MGAGFAGDGQALGLSGANQSHGLLGGDVADMVLAAGFPHQLNVPFHLLPFAFGVVADEAVAAGKFTVVNAPSSQQGFILAVGNNGLVQFFCQQHGLSHHIGRLYAAAVVGKACYVRSHSLQIGEGFAHLITGDGAVGIDFDAGILSDELELLLQLGMEQTAV